MPASSPTATAASALYTLCSAEQRQGDALPAAAGDQVERRALEPAILHVLGAHVRRALDAEGHHLPVEVAAKLGNVLVIGVEHCRPAGVAGSRSVRTWRGR